MCKQVIAHQFYQPADKTTANPVNALELALQSQPRKYEVKKNKKL
jgi:hypothetical protein